MKALGYLRVSGKGQIQGSGFDRQEETIRQYARQAGYVIERLYREAFTGTEADRPVLAEMLQDALDNGCRTVIIESMDRLARELSVQMTLVSLLASKGITLINASTGHNITEQMQADPMVRAMVQIQGCFAELDKNLLIRKLARARRAKRADTGRCEGRKPFGYRNGEAAVVERMRQLYRKPRGEGRMGYHRIATVLNSENQPTRTGKSWSAVTVRRVLERETS